MFHGQRDLQAFRDKGCGENKDQPKDEGGVVADYRFNLSLDLDFVDSCVKKAWYEQTLNQEHDLQEENRAGTHGPVLF